MRLNEIQFTDAKPVEGYGPGFFRIGGDVIEGPALVGPLGTGPWGGYEDAAALVALVGACDAFPVMYVRATAPQVQLSREGPAANQTLSRRGAFLNSGSRDVGPSQR